jgi:hypothetical protein
VVLPLDVPNTPNLTWTVTKPVAGGTQIDGFTATTRVGTMVQGALSHLAFFTAHYLPHGRTRIQ